MVHRSGAAHFIPAYVSGDVFIERWQLAIAPVFVEDVKFQHVTLDLEVIQRRHRVGIVTSSADHSTELVADFANDEILLGRAYAKAKPGSNHVLLGQRGFPWTRLNVARGRSAHALLVDGHGGNRRSLGKNGHNDRQRIGAPGIFHQCALEFGAICASGARYNQIAAIEPGCRGVLIRGASVRIHVRDHESETVGPELAIDKGQRGRVRAIGAIDASHLVPTNGEFIGVRLTLAGSPAAAVVVGIGNLGDGCGNESARQKKRELHFSDHGSSRGASFKISPG